MSGTELSDYEWLVSSAGQAWLARIALDNLPVDRLTARLRREHSTARVHLLVEQLDLRRRAAVKFSRASSMFFTRKALEQATDEVVGRWKAERFAAGEIVFDLCSGIGGDALPLANRGPVAAYELDPATALLARANADAWELDSFTVHEARVDAPLAAACRAARGAAPFAWHLDPDRRASAPRATDWEYLEPGPDVAAAWRDVAGGAVKLAPATSVPERLVDEVERSWVETRGECRQQVVWSGSLALHPGRRSAVVLDRGPAPRIVLGPARDEDEPEPPQFAAPLEYVAEPRPAVYAADLADSLARELGATRLGPAAGYLTLAERRIDPAWQLFRTLEVLPFDRRRLKQAVRQRGWSRLELKTRGVKLDLARLAREWASLGDGGGVILIARLEDRVAAILAERVAG